MARSGNEKITVRSERTGDTTEGKDCESRNGERRLMIVALIKMSIWRCDMMIFYSPHPRRRLSVILDKRTLK